MRSDIFGVVGLVMCLLAIVGIILACDQLIPANGLTVVPILALATIGAMLMVDDRR